MSLGRRKRDGSDIGNIENAHCRSFSPDRTCVVSSSDAVLFYPTLRVEDKLIEAARRGHRFSLAHAPRKWPIPGVEGAGKGRIEWGMRAGRSLASIVEDRHAGRDGDRLGGRRHCFSPSQHAARACATVSERGCLGIPSGTSRRSMAAFPAGVPPLGGTGVRGLTCPSRLKPELQRLNSRTASRRSSAPAQLLGTAWLAASGGTRGGRRAEQDAAVEGLNMQKPDLVRQDNTVMAPHRRQHTPREGPNAEKRRPVGQKQAHDRRGVARGLKGGNRGSLTKRPRSRLIRCAGSAPLVFRRSSERLDFWPKPNSAEAVGI